MPALVPKVSGSFVSTAGVSIELSCLVSVVEYLVQFLILDWSGRGVDQPGVVVGNLNGLDSLVLRNISFSPLKTSHGGQYVCHAGLSIPIIDLEETWNSSTDLKVQSK